MDYFHSNSIKSKKTTCFSPVVMKSVFYKKTSLKKIHVFNKISYKN